MTSMGAFEGKKVPCSLSSLTVEARVNNIFLSPSQKPYLPVGECSFRQLPLMTAVDLPTPGPPLEMLFHRFGCGGAVEFSQFPK